MRGEKGREEKTKDGAVAGEGEGEGEGERGGERENERERERSSSSTSSSSRATPAPRPGHSFVFIRQRPRHARASGLFSQGCWKWSLLLVLSARMEKIKISGTCTPFDSKDAKQFLRNLDPYWK